MPNSANTLDEGDKGCSRRKDDCGVRYELRSPRRTGKRKRSDDSQECNPRSSKQPRRSASDMKRKVLPDSSVAKDPVICKRRRPTLSTKRAKQVAIVARNPRRIGKSHDRPAPSPPRSLNNPIVAESSSSPLSLSAPNVQQQRKVRRQDVRGRDEAPEDGSTKFLVSVNADEDWNEDEQERDILHRSAALCGWRGLDKKLWKVMNESLYGDNHDDRDDDSNYDERIYASFLHVEGVPEASKSKQIVNTPAEPSDSGG